MPNTSIDAFQKCDIENATLHIPSTSIDAYQVIEPWSRFNNFDPMPVHSLVYIIDKDVYQLHHCCEGEMITPEPTPNIDGYLFMGWSEIPEYMPDHDVIVTGTVMSSNFEDGKAYANQVALEDVNLTYTRTFNNTKWQALYVPFSMSYDEWKDDYDVAKINNFHEYDDDEDGTVDRTTMEVIFIKSGCTQPNMPYLIRSKQTGTKTITVNNTPLYPAESNSIDCSSVETKYTFTGTYAEISGAEMYGNGYYALSGGVLSLPASSEVSLESYRWYLKLESRLGYFTAASRPISVRVVGEDNYETTGIANNSVSNKPVEYYNLKGEKINPLGISGICIIRYADGKKKKIVNK